MIEAREPFHLTRVFGWVGGKCARKLRLLKASSRSEEEKTPIWMMGKELNCVFSWYDCWECPAELEWRLTTISAAALSCDRQAIQHKEDSGPQLHSGSHHYTYQPHQNSRQNWYCKATSIVRVEHTHIQVQHETHFLVFWHHIVSSLVSLRYKNPNFIYSQTLRSHNMVELILPSLLNDSQLAWKLEVFDSSTVTWQHHSFKPVPQNNTCLS